MPVQNNYGISIFFMDYGITMVLQPLKNIGTVMVSDGNTKVL